MTRHRRKTFLCGVGPGQCKNPGVVLLPDTVPICLFHLLAFGLPFEERLKIHRVCVGDRV